MSSQSDYVNLADSGWNESLVAVTQAACLFSASGVVGRLAEGIAKARQLRLNWLQP